MMNPKSETNNILPLVFIHGSFANANSWRKIIQELENDYDCLAINLPGHGAMSDPDDFDHPTLKPEFDAIETALENIVDADLGIHLIGHSYGGVVALAAAMTSQIPVRKLTLFEPVDAAVLPVFNEHDAMKTVSTFVSEYQQASKDGERFACASVIDFWGGTGSFAAIPEHIQQAMAKMTKNNLRHWDICVTNSRQLQEYQNLKIPVTLINGGRSNSVAKVIASSLNRHLPNSRLEIIDQASHFMITTHVDECVAIIRNM